VSWPGRSTPGAKRVKGTRLSARRARLSRAFWVAGSSARLLAVSFVAPSHGLPNWATIPLQIRSSCASVMPGESVREPLARECLGNREVTGSEADGPASRCEVHRPRIVPPRLDAAPCEIFNQSPRRRHPNVEMPDGLAVHVVVLARLAVHAQGTGPGFEQLFVGDQSARVSHRAEILRRVELKAAARLAVPGPAPPRQAPCAWQAR
jgi:hypothetical protein